jgi:glyoxylase-like metal-dependent hydrolase (beta-lactamase superfamily II)/rhodanese-related sulfurtransferase
MKPDATPETFLSAAALAEHLAAGDHITVLDVRDDLSGAIEGPATTLVHRPARAALADPAALAATLNGPVAVVCNRGLSARPVADALTALGVDAQVLEGGIRGWLGALQQRPVELGLPNVDVRQIQRPGRGCLSYVVATADEALVVDPAPDTGFYLDLAAEMGARITAVVDTHLHADHLSGARAVAAAAGARLLLPAAALERGVAYPVTPLEDGAIIALGDLEVRALALPGHTTDMTGLLVAGRALIAGDSLFADGIARPDLQKGDPEGARAMGRLLHATIHDRILTLGDDVVLLAGHTHPGVHPAAIAPMLGQVRQAVSELSLTDPDAFAAELLADMPPRPANYEAVIAVNAGTHPFDPDLESGGNSCSTR